MFRATVLPVIPVIPPTGARAGAVVRLKSEPCYPSYQNEEGGDVHILGNFHKVENFDAVPATSNLLK